VRVVALKQVLGAAVEWELLDRNPAGPVRVPVAHTPELDFFDGTEEVDVVAEEIGQPWGSMIIVGAETGLRPQELVAIERRDVDHNAGVLHVMRCYTVDAGTKGYGKTSRSLRTVPLTDRALTALDELPVQLRTPVIFPSFSGGYRNGAGVGQPGHLNLRNWRRRHWTPALRAAGLERDGKPWLPVPYVLRHSFASWALEAGFDLWELARLMGTSALMIDRHYGHLAKGHAERARDRLNRRPSLAPAKAEIGE
jgi:integrase